MQLQLKRFFNFIILNKHQTTSSRSLCLSAIIDKSHCCRGPAPLLLHILEPQYLSFVRQSQHLPVLKPPHSSISRAHARLTTSHQILSCRLYHTTPTLAYLSTTTLVDIQGLCPLGHTLSIFVVSIASITATACLPFNNHTRQNPGLTPAWPHVFELWCLDSVKQTPHFSTTTAKIAISRASPPSIHTSSSLQWRSQSASVFRHSLSNNTPACWKQCALSGKQDVVVNIYI